MCSSKSRRISSASFSMSPGAVRGTRTFEEKKKIQDFGDIGAVCVHIGEIVYSPDAIYLGSRARLRFCCGRCGDGGTIMLEDEECSLENFGDASTVPLYRHSEVSSAIWNACLDIQIDEMAIRLLLIELYIEGNER